MNTQIIIKKGPYVAVPNKKQTVAANEVVGAYKTKGKPFVAYPKSAAEPKEPIATKVTMEEGLYIAYPKSQQETQEQDITSNSTADTGFFAANLEPAKSKGWFNYRYMSGNRFCPISFIDLFKMKAS